MGYGLRFLGVLVTLGASWWLLRGLDFKQLAAVVTEARPGYLLLVPVSVLAEQWVRAWKWRQIVTATCELRTTWAFRALMAGYVPGLAVGFGTSALTRSWLLARHTGERTSTLLASTTVDRLIDAFAFAFFTGLAAAAVQLPTSQMFLTWGLRWSGLLIAVIALLVLVLLAGLQRGRIGWLISALRLLPSHPRQRLEAALAGYAQGITWPRSLARRVGVAAAALFIKLTAATQYLWAGLAFGVLLTPGDYLFIMVFLGTLVFLGFFVRLPGSGLLASLFALELLGVTKAKALSMTLIVMASFILTIIIGGGIALIREGVALSEMVNHIRAVMDSSVVSSTRDDTRD